MMPQSVTLLSAVDATSNRTSGVLDLGDIRCAAFGIAFTDGASNLVGTLTLEGSIDNSNFITYPASSVAVAASAPHVYDLPDTAMRYFRVKWVFTSGTGNIAVTGWVKRVPVVGV